MIFFPFRDYPESHLQIIVDSSRSPLKLEKFVLLRLRKNTVYSGRIDDQEAAFVLMRGKGKMWVDNVFLGETGVRQSVFSSPAWSFYLPPHTSYRIEVQEESEFAVVLADSGVTGSGKKTEANFIRPEDVSIKRVGKDAYLRDVHTIIGSSFPANTFMVGETFNQPGLWSSYPPHRHEKNQPPQEYKLEEIYHYRFNPERGFGVQCLYTDDKQYENAYLVKNGDTLVIPRGYHPVVAAPGYSMYYFWSLAGERRILSPYEDPAHQWIHSEGKER